MKEEKEAVLSFVSKRTGEPRNIYLFTDGLGTNKNKCLWDSSCRGFSIRMSNDWNDEVASFDYFIGSAVDFEKDIDLVECLKVLIDECCMFVDDDLAEYTKKACDLMAEHTGMIADFFGLSDVYELFDLCNLFEED